MKPPSVLKPPKIIGTFSHYLDHIQKVKMEKSPSKAAPISVVLKENQSQDQNTKESKSPVCISGKNGTPDRLKLPKAFNYVERYTSPTDQMMSPVTKGILGRSRKGSRLLPPSAELTKVLALQLESGPVSN